MIPPRIKEVQALDDFFLKITYVNGEEKSITINKLKVKEK